MLKIHLYNNTDNKWLIFDDPVEIVSSFDSNTIIDQLCYIEKRIKDGNLWAAGFLGYEASSAFDPHLKVHSLSEYPLMTFGLFKQPRELAELPFDGTKEYSFTAWQSAIYESQYYSAIDTIKQQIQQGNTYQVNFTFPLYSTFKGSYYSLFHHMVHAQKAPYAALVETETHIICSASPELFFKLDGTRLYSKPMKGTAPRGKYSLKDAQSKRNLKYSTKNRAENVMIVDMIRNDMGRIAELNSVSVPKLYSIEQYPTVWQMTSTVQSRTLAPVSDIFKALFPCASITGAPKVSTMHIINQLENYPRGIYTGSIGYVSPDKKAQFNVAIRTLIQNKSTGKAVYNIGSGIVWDSKPHDEFQESLLKAKILNHKYEPFRLLETLLWQPHMGFFLLDIHLKRLRQSARYFGFKINNQYILEKLNQSAKSFKNSTRVRLLVDSVGNVEIQSFMIEADPNTMARICFANEPVDKSSVWLYHKTTNRKIYDTYINLHQEYDDVLLYNHKGEITETSMHNLVVNINDILYTPPVSCGLLAGTFREHLLKKGEIKERILYQSDVIQAKELFLINSVRKWRKCEIKS